MCVCIFRTESAPKESFHGQPGWQWAVWRHEWGSGWIIYGVGIAAKDLECLFFMYSSGWTFHCCDFHFVNVYMCHHGSKSQAGQQASGFPGQSILSDPMSNLAVAYGSSLATQGREMVDKNVRQIQKCIWCECMQRTQILSGARVLVQARSIHPNFQAEVLFCCWYALCGKEVGPCGFPVHAWGKSISSVWKSTCHFLFCYYFQKSHLTLNLYL